MLSKKKIITSLWIITVLVLGEKWYEMSAPPTGEKKCDTYPLTVDVSDLSSIQHLLESQAWELKNQVNVTQEWGYINDASCLNKTPIYAVVKVGKVSDIQSVIQFARKHALKITPYGIRHSMGGQSFSRWWIAINMDAFNTMHLEGNILTVGAGAKWEEVQRFLDPLGFSVKAMQSINIFSVGGTISVNAHGIAHNPGPIASTIRSLTIVDPNGVVKTVSPEKYPDLFSHIIGGYGLFGVIVSAELEVVPNDLYDWHRTYMDYHDFYQYYLDHVKGKDEVGLFYGRISLSPTTYMNEAAAHVYTKTSEKAPTNSLSLPGKNILSRFVVNFSKTGGFGRWLRWMLEKYIEPSIHPCISRNIAINDTAEICQVTRNQEMYDTMNYLKNNLKDTDVLQEYFIPEAQMVDFIDGLRKIVTENQANLINITIRVVHKDTISKLPYAREDMFAYVLYFNQKLNDHDSHILKKTTQDIIDLAESLHGTFYLPYQLFYSADQLRRSYPTVDDFMRDKKVYDPEALFSNTWYNKYSQLLQK